MLIIESFVFNPFQENTYILSDETQQCIIIDPGCHQKNEESKLLQYIEDNQLTVVSLINTHCHIDHVLGNYYVKRTFNVPLFIHPIEAPYLKAVKTYAPNYGFFQYQEVEADSFLDEKDLVKFGNQSLKILFVPGHSAGHIALYHTESHSLISGDVLFYNSIGRTDLPGGDHNTLLKSISDKVFSLPDDTIVYPGHGPTTTVGYEKKTNPFCKVN